jgi:hypothetical protein
MHTGCPQPWQQRRPGQRQRPKHTLQHFEPDPGHTLQQLTLMATLSSSCTCQMRKCQQQQQQLRQQTQTH